MNTDLSKAQEYLNMISGDGDRVSQIANISLLIQRNPPDVAISYLRRLHEKNRKKLRRLLRKNVSDSKINDVVAINFRIKMAINTIRNFTIKEAEAA